MFPRMLLLAALLLTAGAITLPAEAAVECRAERGNSGYWTWRLIDGKRCWYPGKEKLQKSSLHWPPEPKQPAQEDDENVLLPNAQAPKTEVISLPTARAELRSEQPDQDLAFGAYQRGYYLIAFSEAMRRINTLSDAKAMTLLGELYAHGLGVVRDDVRAAEWYMLAADRGDREGMYALAMLRLAGSGGERERDAAIALLDRAAWLGHVGAAYDLGLIYLDAKGGAPNYTRAAEFFQSAADAGNPDAQYALGTLYKEGRGVPKDRTKATHLMSQAARADNLEAQIEYAIALYNGDGVPKDESAGSKLLQKAARQGSPVAQNRLARVLASGQGLPASPAEAVKWHLVARTNGQDDLWLESFLLRVTPEQRQAGEKSAEPWLTTSASPSPISAVGTGQAQTAAGEGEVLKTFAPQERGHVTLPSFSNQGPGVRLGSSGG